LLWFEYYHEQRKVNIVNHPQGYVQRHQTIFDRYTQPQRVSAALYSEAVRISIQAIQEILTTDYIVEAKLYAVRVPHPIESISKMHLKRPIPTLSRLWKLIYCLSSQRLPSIRVMKRQSLSMQGVHIQRNRSWINLRASSPAFFAWRRSVYSSGASGYLTQIANS